MADQWEYLMVTLDYQLVNGKTGQWNFMLGQLTSDGQISGTAMYAPEALNGFGAQGWELIGTGNVSSATGSGQMILIFKRRTS